MEPALIAYDVQADVRNKQFRCEFATKLSPPLGNYAQHGVKHALMPRSTSSYHETIHIIYAANCFEFSNTWSLTYLHPTVPHEQWNDIRMLDLKWAFPGHWLPSRDPVKTIYVLDGRQQWVDTCKIILRMKRLEHFTLHLTGNWFGEPVEKIPTFIEPLKALRLKQTWKILLPAQPYYRNEIGRLNVILQKKGMDCSVREA